MSEETKVTTNTTGTMAPNTFAVGQGTITTPNTFIGVGQPGVKQEAVVDYEKLVSILDGRQKATEESVLKGYFKEQGLTGEEVSQAIEAFKKEKASKEPNINELNNQISLATERALKAELELAATGIASELGVSSAKVPYLLKMAETGKATKEGKVNRSILKEALEAVLNDLPELKSTTQENGIGSFKVGMGSEGNETNNDQLASQLAQAFGVKTK